LRLVIDGVGHGYPFFAGSTVPLALASDFFSFLIIIQTVGLLERVISSSQGLYLNTGQHKHRTNTYTYQTSMPCVGFEPTNPASERAKTVHYLRPLGYRDRSWITLLPHISTEVNNEQLFHAKDLKGITYYWDVIIMVHKVK
jgi:hypothetical protein